LATNSTLDKLQGETHHGPPKLAKKFQLKAVDVGNIYKNLKL